MLVPLARRLRVEALVRSGHIRTAGGTPLPPRPFRMGGRHFETNEAFELAAREEVGRLEGYGLKSDARLLDWGCGAGRLAVGIRECMGRLNEYHGVDVQKPLVRWAQRHIAGPGFNFAHVNSSNARYNPAASANKRIPGDSGYYDVFYAYSVLSHMTGADVCAYLLESARLLKADGFAFVTAFVEDSVGDEEENPAGYGPIVWEGPLHCVRFERGYFDRMVACAGLQVDDFQYGSETDGQSLYVLRPVN